MKILLVTGYEPFAGYPVNSSWECARALPNEINGVQIEKRLLPVEYGRGTEMLEELLYSLRPAAVLSLGMAPGWGAISIERMGFNLRDTSAPDNAGIVLHDQPIKEDGADGYFTTLPHHKMKAALEAEGIPAAFSTSPGFYLCNNAMYIAQYHARKDMPGMRAGFIHVPLMEGQSETLAVFPREQLERGIFLSAEAICAELAE